MTSALVFKTTYPHAPEQVWQALTHPKALAAWLMDNDFEPSVGHHFQFKDASLPGLETVIDCEVIALEPPTRLVYTWQASSMPTPSLVTWMLIPIEGGTQLQLHHSGLTTMALPFNPTSMLMQPGHQPQQQGQASNAQALLTLSMPQAYPDFASSVTTGSLLEMVFADEWKHRLHQALPEVLVQLVKA